SMRRLPRGPCGDRSRLILPPSAWRKFREIGGTGSIIIRSRRRRIAPMLLARHTSCRRNRVPFCVRPALDRCDRSVVTSVSLLTAMTLPQTYVASLVLMIFSMLCWGSWANTFKLAGNWRFELFYFDYSIGVLLAAGIAAFTFGTLGSDGFQF